MLARSHGQPYAVGEAIRWLRLVPNTSAATNAANATVEVTQVSIDDRRHVTASPTPIATSGRPRQGNVRLLACWATRRPDQLVDAATRIETATAEATAPTISAAAIHRAQPVRPAASGSNTPTAPTGPVGIRKAATIATSAPMIAATTAGR